MKIKIYKGTDEIGGSCIELSTKSTKILLDYGTALKKGSEQVKVNSHLDAIVISHPHQDHFGEIVNLDLAIPIYCGKLSLELMNATKIFTGGSILKNKFVHYQSWKSFTIGDFKITPYLVDHSAVDAHALLVEAEGKKVLYSGDFRSNGRKSKLFEKMINDKNIKDIDILLMEGTMLQRSNKDFPDENSVEDKIIQTIKENHQISFMIGSSQNIDSIVSAYRACIKTNTILVIDIYTAWILEKLKLVSNSIPNMSWKNVQVIKNFGGSYYQKIKENKDFFKSFGTEVFKNTVELSSIKNNPDQYLLKISPWHIDKVLGAIEIKEANIIYSQWLGYLKKDFSNDRTVDLYQNLKEKYNWVYAHTGGHADLETLQKYASTIKAKTLIPIHTEYKNEFKKYFDNVVVLDDGEDFKL